MTAYRTAEYAKAARDAEWNRSLRPSGMDDETWEKEGPKNPEQAVAFVVESERMGAEYVEELDRQHAECEARREAVETMNAKLRSALEDLLAWPQGNDQIETARALIAEIVSEPEDPAQS